MKKITSSVLAALLLASPLSTVSASANDGQAVSRGQFFKLVVDHLDYDISNVKVELPKDISANSPYAEAAKVLKDKKIVAGFGDGTFKPNQTITPAEVSTVVARVLSINGDAKKALAANYGINFENNSTVSLEKAQEIIAKTLTSDKRALELLDKSTVAQNQQKSFQVNGTMAMDFKMKDGAAEISDMPNGMKMDSDIAMTFNKEKGLMQTITTKVPNPMTNEQQKMVMEQYFVPEGIFMKMSDPTTGEDQWLDMSASLPMSFEDLMKMNEQNMNVMTDLNRKYFFYRDLGMEEMNGSNQYKLSFSGKITSFTEIMDVMSKALNDQSGAMLSSLEGLPNIEMTMNGKMWIDEKTMLPTRQSMEYELKYGETKDPAMAIPIESIHYVMDFDYSNYNQANDVVLPEAAKNAEKLPGFEEVSQEQLPVEQK